ncbi:PIG-L deacetylase family protein [Streptomyces sp. NPDC091371]|uniref:PIG-L deacetylase family protein n=1 Tax=Streptomyces sp. NPDC091371 TaxID=3155303 RepID=UPI0034330417
MAIGAHPDDIEFGCGGTLLRHAAQGVDITMVVVSDGALGGDPKLRSAEQIRAARLIGAKVVMLGLSDGRLGSLADLVARLEQIADEVAPDLVYSHLPEDTHQDHVKTHRATAVATRRQANVLMFESPRSPIQSTGITVGITEFIEAKTQLLAAHASQLARLPELTDEGIRARARLHGLRCGDTYAEMFTPLRFSLPIGGNA